ncbi:MAG: DNA repair protein RecN [Pseudomonadota bacterium]
MTERAEAGAAPDADLGAAVAGRLAALEIRDIVLIERLSLECRPGLNVLTGETGAGKSILLDALGFALGRKVRRDLVRGGAAQGSVTAVFEIARGHGVTQVLEALELAGPEDGELVLRRVARADGPATAFVNDQRVSAAALARIGAALVEVHGQHDDRSLLDPKAHRSLLDLYAANGAERTAVREAHAQVALARRALEEAQARLAAAARDADFLRHAVAELDKIAPEEGEEERLDAERRTMQAAQRIGEDVAKAAEELSPAGAEGAMAAALARLTRISERADGRLDGAIAALDRAMVELGEAQSGVADTLEAMAFSPERLELVEERLFALRALARKHDVHPGELASLGRDLAERLAAIDAGEDHLVALRVALAAAEATYEAAATALSASRRAAAGTLDALVTAELAPLKMEAARFLTVVEPGEPGPEGADRVSFTASINPGMAPGPIDRIASGGELSRFLLAIKVCLAAGQDGLTMVFDEIDRGVGGATAAAVGRRLSRLAERAQVLVVTHSPQVAAAGHAHWRIAKHARGGETRTEVTALDRPARLAELARMLAGEQVTDEALRAAEALRGERAASPARAVARCFAKAAWRRGGVAAWRR